jgi:hypothetical protein
VTVNSSASIVNRRASASVIELLSLFVEAAYCFRSCAVNWQPL